MKMMVVSVGGSPEPVIYSLNEQQPDYVVYFASKDSRKLISSEIESQLTFTPVDVEKLVTADEQDLLVCVQYLLKEVPRCLQLWDVSVDNIICDYTGGTKTMSAAIVLALSSFVRQFSYVGGVSRDKDGLGVVIGGREHMLYVQNPWDALAIRFMREIELMFNRCRFQSVIDVAQAAKLKTEDKAPFFAFIRDVAEGFYCWDGVQYDKAYKLLKQCTGKLPTLFQFSNNRELDDFSRQLCKSFERLTLIKDQSDQLKPNKGKKIAQGVDPLCRDFLADIVANAVRRAEVEHKYDDAVARLYSAIEKLAKITLQVEFSINNSSVDVALIDDNDVKQWLENECGGEGLPIMLPLSRSYELLYRLHHPLGVQFEQHRLQLEKVLSIRNNSILAHGYDSVSGKTYCDMLNIALQFLDLQKNDLPTFPQMNWGYQGLS
ncbi:MAG: TIGR02710 family CRISPR-associated CARF protein [Thermodesulfobacteriota bacterium]|nr:TIGR02710 family CRISPR-associated CARF protein [Thermodesulfobacteriota bacterium]